MKQGGRWLARLVMLSWAFGLWVTGMGLNVLLAQAADLSVTDGLTSPGKPIQLQARLTNPEADGEIGLPDQALEFIVHGRTVGQANTDAKGWARLDFVPSMRGNLSIVVKVVTPSKAEAIEGKGVLLSWERRRPILLIDLAVVVAGELVTDPPPSELYQDPGLMLGDAHPAAAVELGKLAEFYYNLVYLDLTGRGHLEDIQDWLRHHQFPPGMIRILPKAPTALTELIHDLKTEGWEKVSGGIGRTPDFAEVLVQNRLQTVILPLPQTQGHFPRRAIVLNDWSRVRRHL
ncbi:MAG: hypothetical protein CO149_03210 [Nitrospirae bacterium CG_4_9_14_3_um_filter_51_5]|nr:MAG: hypothetical protein CO149_03210 [Nitrospirae bacterium CG_4_9_14_3_um_filter_51_5]